MYKGLYTILITINIVATIAISLFCFFFFLGPLGCQFYYCQMLPSLNKVLPT